LTDQSGNVVPVPTEVSTEVEGGQSISEINEYGDLVSDELMRQARLAWEKKTKAREYFCFLIDIFVGSFFLGQNTFGNCFYFRWEQCVHQCWTCIVGG